MKRTISLLMIAATVVCALAFPLVACQGEASPSKSDDLTIWMRQSDSRDYIDKVFDLYESKTGNDLNVRVIPEGKFASEIERAFAEGDAPDILMHYNDSALAKLGIKDNFLMLNDQAWADTILAGSRAYSDDGMGNLVGLPFWESSISGCYFNKTILSSLGLKPASTQAEFDMLCQALVSVGYTPLFWGDNCGWMYQFGLDPIFSDNPELLRRLNSGEIDYADIPQVRSMVQWIFDAYKKGWLGDPKNKTLSDISEALASGEVVMVDIWDTWFETDFEPERYKASDFAIMPVFMGTTDNGTYEGGNLNMMLVNKNAKHLDEAIGFLEFCATPEIYNQAFKGVPSVKVFEDQDTIVTSQMIVDASDSIAQLERASVANPKIHGFSQDDMKAAFTALFNGEVDVDGCIAMMDELRHKAM